jgi:DNA mismatch repair protein MutL
MVQKPGRTVVSYPEGRKKMTGDEHRIHVLDEETVNQIAAGEVVERPASVVKELVENAIDAGATRVEVEVSAAKGAVTRIRVTDDGCGMGPADAALAFTRHATSKITRIADLSECNTLGFRGEALASIASVAKVTLLTGTRGAGAGTKIVVRGGALVESADAGTPGGTTVIVEDLFFNTPARKKFQKSLAWEVTRITGVVEEIAISHPDIAFRMVFNRREKISTQSASNLREAIACLFGTGVAEEMIPVNGSHPLVQLSGYLSPPGLSRPNPYQMYIAINRRHIHSLPLIGAVREGYGTLLAKDTYPVVFLNLEIDTRLVDVNVHPTKRQVRLGHEREIGAVIAETVWNALKGESLVTEAHVEGERGTVTGVYPVRAGNPRHVRETCHPYLLETDRQLRQTELPTGIRAESLLPEMEVIGQFADSYIIARTAGDELFLVDQHAAHERILYEQVSEKSRGGGGSQELLVPVIVHLSPTESALIPRMHPLLEEEGFVIEEFGRDRYAVRAVPVVLGRLEDELVIHELISELLAEDVRGVPDRKERICRIVACHGAIRAGTACTREQCERILAQLARTENPYSCPHGRPTIVSFSRDRIDRMFKR